MVSDIRFEVIKKIADTRFKFRNFKDISKLDSNSPPDIFIGSKLRYPLVNVGILSPLQRDDNAWLYDAEKYWAENNFEIQDVISLRDNLLNSRFQSKVKDVRINKENKFLEIAKEIAMSSKPVDLEIELNRNLRVGKEKDRVTMPVGMKAPLKKARITGNVSIPSKIDKVATDELKASDAIKYLYKNNFDEYLLSKILSVGVLGLKKNKRLVPTRWSITATDDTIGKQLLENVRNYNWIENYELFYGEFLGNQYILLFFPGVWSYELFELYAPGSSWNPTTQIKASTDNEDFYGRKSYAFNTVGGYYASRLAIIEYLNGIKKQASVLAIRIETPSYWAALGVWVVRESVRKALASKRFEFSTKEELVESAKQISKLKYKFDNSQIISKSKLLNSIKTQKSLRDYGV